MEFREDIGQYVFEYEGLIFAWDEEPEEDIQDTVKTLANNYFKHLDGIIDFMLPDIKEIYGQVTVEDVKRNLGRPIVDYDNGKVTYCEQSFDDCHIFEFEFMDDAFEKLQYFSIHKIPLSRHGLQFKNRSNLFLYGIQKKQPSPTAYSATVRSAFTFL